MDADWEGREVVDCGGRVTEVGSTGGTWVGGGLPWLEECKNTEGDETLNFCNPRYNVQ